MRVLHVADVHAGILTHSVVDPETGLPSALVSSLRCFEAAVDVALEFEVDGVIVAGDIYHSPNPPAAAIVGIDEQLDRLREEVVPTLLYPGNHDRAPRPGQRSILSVHGGGTVEVVESDVLTALGNDLVVGVLPSFSRQRFGDVSREEAERLTVDALERQLGSWAEGEPLAPDIVSGHWPISGSLLGGEVDIAVIAEPMLSPAELEGPWRYAAMGHIHRAQEIRSGEQIVGAYAGAVDRTNFGEEDYTPTATIVDLDGTEDDHTRRTFVALPARVFRTIELETPMYGSLDTEDLLAANEGGIIRLRGRFRSGEPYTTAVAMAREMAGVLRDSGASIVRVEVEEIRPDRVRVADITQAPTELEALERWIEHHELEPEVAAGLREFAQRLVEEVETR